jgi:hypothetical protein
MEGKPMSDMLMIEPERDENGKHAAIVDVSEGAVLHVTDSSRPSRMP